jgi:hypothetical protein
MTTAFAELLAVLVLLAAIWHWRRVRPNALDALGRVESHREVWRQK